MNIRNCFFVILVLFPFSIFSQPLTNLSSSEIYQKLLKLKGKGSVLYIAAHPDDENTRLLSYLSAEKHYRTAYLSLTRGDGGQNLIGDEQGIDLGLIRTQELLAARRMDGADQFFTRAYDFGYSKSPDEALKIWGHDEILADVVWVIRKFRPDVIITRFPETGEGGHGHHTASAILAREAFDAAADPLKFPEQFKHGVDIWKANRLLWNTFNFGGTNTTREGQFKIDVGGYNPVLGFSYGEISALSRSNHRSQGFGVPSQRGTQYEYFLPIRGSAPVHDLMEELRFEITDTDRLVDDIINNYDPSDPTKIVGKLQELYKAVSARKDRTSQQDPGEIAELILAAGGVFLDVTAGKQVNAIGDSATFNTVVNNRTGIPVRKIKMSLLGNEKAFATLSRNENENFTIKIPVNLPAGFSQPYWLREPMQDGRFSVSDQSMIGLPWNEPLNASFEITIDNTTFNVKRPVRYKFTDPVKGELYQPVHFVSSLSVESEPSMLLLRDGLSNEQKSINYSIKANRDVTGKLVLKHQVNGSSKIILDSVVDLNPSQQFIVRVPVKSNDFKNSSRVNVSGNIAWGDTAMALRRISYDHIPDILYQYIDRVTVIRDDIKTTGKYAGYIEGAGDKVPEALEQLGYSVDKLTEKDITASNLKKYDVIITGVRAYNVHPWLSNSQAVLMNYVKDGGVMLVQYNTNNTIGPIRTKIFPYDFNISRKRITDEKASVKLLVPDHPVFNYPNKITAKDFEGWIQERSVYHAEKADPAFTKLISMKDPGEGEEDGSLIMARHGKGKLIYTGLSLFRQLPAGVPGAYRLFANLISR